MNNELVWLHLSDIHFHPKTEWRDNAIRQELLDFLKDRFANGLPKPQLVFCTGDIAFGETSGAPLSEQYRDAAKFFDELLACCGISKERLFMVPGNHDVNRKEISTDQQARLIDMAKSSGNHVADINQRFADCSRDHRSAMDRLDDYGTFVQEYRPELYRENYHLYAHILEVAGYRVGVAGFNSAWSCAGPEDDRNMWLASEWQFNHMAAGLREADLKIGLIHHPFDWLNATEHHDAEVRASKNLHFLLHGHTHTAWVRPTDNCVQLAAGAVGADTSDQFGINLVRLNPLSGECCVHLFGFNHGWMIQPIAKHAPEAQWIFGSSVRLSSHSVLQPALKQDQLTPQTVSVQAHNPDAQSLIGRAKLLSVLTSSLKENNGLALHGLSGNGKTALIKELHKQAPFTGMVFVDIHCSRQMTVGEFFRRMLDVLHSNREDPHPPSGTVKARSEELKRLYPNAQQGFIWVNNAHLLLEGPHWRTPEICMLLAAFIQAFPGWKWLFELNEKPDDGCFGREIPLLEVSGLDKAGLAEFLLSKAPGGKEADWTYTGDKLKALYQWLGGGHGGSAHTLAIELLTTVAREQLCSPFDVYKTLRNDVIDRLDEALLSVLHKDVIGDAERSLLKVLALYRNSIPQDHADYLEDGMNVFQAWKRLRGLGLLPLDNNKDHYLHGFIASWIRQKQLALDDTETCPDYMNFNTPAVSDMHLLIARCWQRQIGRQKEQINFLRANEAFFHLLCAGEPEEMEDWIYHLRGSEIGWSNEALWAIYHRRRSGSESIARQQEVLQLLVNIFPSECKAWRFLGECMQKTQSKGCDDALQAFERALELDPNFPPYLANVGQTLLAQGKAGAKKFLHRMETYQKQYPKAVNDYVLSIQNRCVEEAFNAEEASTQRLQAIEDGSVNSTFYNEEAIHQLMQEADPVKALYLLDLATKRNVSADDYSYSIRGQVLEKLDRGPEASELRMAKIRGGSKNANFFNDEAQYQLNQCNDPYKANEILEQALALGCEDRVTSYIHRRVLQSLKQKNGVFEQKISHTTGSSHP